MRAQTVHTNEKKLKKRKRKNFQGLMKTSVKMDVDSVDIDVNQTEVFQWSTSTRLRFSSGQRRPVEDQTEVFKWLMSTRLRFSQSTSTRLRFSSGRRRSTVEVRLTFSSRPIFIHTAYLAIVQYDFMIQINTHLQMNANKQILTRDWSAQHPNTGQNFQHTLHNPPKWDLVTRFCRWFFFCEIIS